MQIDRVSAVLTLSLPARAALPSLRVGDQLVANVLRADPSRILLEIGDARIEARTPLPLQPGQQLLLRVAQLQPAIVLRLVDGATPEDAVDTALRTLLPQPNARAPLSDAIARLAATPSTPLPAAVQDALTGLLNRLPRADSLTRPDALARVLAGSGLFLETQLARADAAPPAGDLKLALLQLLQVLRPLKTAQTAADAAGVATGRELFELAEATEGALSRMQILQLHAATSPKLDLMFELPVLFGSTVELLQLRVEEDEHADPEEPGGEAKEPGQQVRLGFGFGESGRLDALVRLRGERLSVLWWAERPECAAVLRENLPLLAARLHGLGLEIRELSCLDGRPRPLDALPILRRQGVLRERA